MRLFRRSTATDIGVTSIRKLRFLLAIALSAMTGCASVQDTESGDGYLGRAVVHADDHVVVTASVLAGDEIASEFGVRLDVVGIQPVWLRIKNLKPYTYVLFPKSIDPDYFSPYEVARRSLWLSDAPLEALYETLREKEIRRYITPGAEVSGFVYSHLDEGLKAFNVDLVGNQRHHAFNIAVDVPGLTTDYGDLDLLDMDAGTVSSLNDDRLRQWLTSLTCCTTSADGVPGDPLNLVFVGDVEAIRAALGSRGWDVTARIDAGSIRRILSAFVFGSRYRYAPISGLYVFGRVQDMTFQKARAVINERNHIRLWRAPIAYQGIPVWIGHVSRDAGVKLSGRVWPPTTHVIDPAVDEARFYLEQDLLYSHNVWRFGMVTGVGRDDADAPRTNAEGDPYFTDGLRAVFFIVDDYVPISGLEILDWNLPAELEPFRSNIFPPR